MNLNPGIPQSARATIEANTSSSILIGVAAPLDHAYGYGWDIVNSVQLAISQTNAAGGISVGGITYTLAMTVANSGCANDAMAVAAANDLIAAGAVAVVGPGCSYATKVAAPIFAAAGVAAITPSASDPTVTQQGYTTTFRTTSHMGGASRALAVHFYYNLGLQNTAILYPVDMLWAETLVDAYVDRHTVLGGTVTSVNVISSTADITATLLAIQAEGAQSIFIPDIISQFAGEVSRVALSLGLTQTIGLPGPVDGYIATYAGPSAAEGDFGTGMERRPVDMPGYPPFEAAYLAAGFPNEPMPDAAYSPTSYDAANIIMDAVQQAGTTTDTLAIRDAIAATTNFVGVSGTYEEFDSNGDVVPQWARVSVVENGEWVLALIQVEIYTALGGIVNLENALGVTTTLTIPPAGGGRTAAVGSSVQSVTANYTMLFTTTNAGNPALRMMEDHGLRLTASVPLTTEMSLTVHYANEDVAGIDESTLTFYYWNGSQWVDAEPCGEYVRDVVNNVLAVGICKLGDYVLLGEIQHTIFLPMIVKNP
jgi:branched-chain amino acid transport system substrate-binding protein